MGYRLWRRTHKGASATEYAVLLGTAGVLVMGAALAFGETVRDVFNGNAVVIADASAGPPPRPILPPRDDTPPQEEPTDPPAPPDDTPEPEIPTVPPVDPTKGCFTGANTQNATNTLLSTGVYVCLDVGLGTNGLSVLGGVGVDVGGTLIALPELDLGLLAGLTTGLGGGLVGLVDALLPGLVDENGTLLGLGAQLGTSLGLGSTLDLDTDARVFTSGLGRTLTNTTCASSPVGGADRFVQIVGGQEEVRTSGCAHTLLLAARVGSPSPTLMLDVASSARPSDVAVVAGESAYGDIDVIGVSSAGLSLVVGNDALTDKGAAVRLDAQMTQNPLVTGIPTAEASFAALRRHPSGAPAAGQSIDARFDFAAFFAQNGTRPAQARGRALLQDPQGATRIETRGLETARGDHRVDFEVGVEWTRGVFGAAPMPDIRGRGAVFAPRFGATAAGQRSAKWTFYNSQDPAIHLEIATVNGGFTQVQTNRVLGLVVGLPLPVLASEIRVYDTSFPTPQGGLLNLGLVALPSSYNRLKLTDAAGQTRVITINSADFEPRAYALRP